MAPPQRVRVLRCYSCRLFQADQVKKSPKWTCKACGEKQSFLRAYGEGSGADCRRHVQKLNLLQGQVSEISLRSLEESVNAKEGENAGHQQAENARSQPSENRWLKYLEKDSKELEPAEGGVYSNMQPSLQKEEPDPPFSKHLPRKRKWGLSTIHPPGSPDAGDSGTREGSSKVTLQPQEGYSGLTARVKGESSGCLQNSEHWKSPSPAQEVKLPSSKWERFLVSPADTELPRPLQTGPRPASPGGHPSRPPAVLQLPQATCAPPPGPKKPCRKTTEPSGGPGTIQAEGGHSVHVEEKAPPVLLCDLFSTGEDFDDDL
ncbi:MRN complex-interacting protein [Dasypus novemcinctus]|uniref:MRN complex-interacting protein n=1 Tax=Dasypus novemcinctus TaxID=9361 RepID=UPI00265F4DC1|nr:MRN complex-interacting protein [Dasypus novemcinctus]